VAILITLPYFIATIATIIYTNRKTRKGNTYDDKSKGNYEDDKSKGNYEDDKSKGNYEDDKSKGTNLLYVVLISSISCGTSMLCEC
jgi:hypothetical protein